MEQKTRRSTTNRGGDLLREDSEKKKSKTLPTWQSTAQRFNAGGSEQPRAVRKNKKRAAVRWCPSATGKEGTARKNTGRAMDETLKYKSGKPSFSCRRPIRRRGGPFQQ